MPVSTSIHLTHCVQRIAYLQPRSVLDIGCGFGLWGFLCREYIDVWNGRVAPSQWQTRIDGVEVFEPYIQPHHKCLYTNIITQDIREAVKHIDDYDLIIAGDVLEHLEKPEAEALLETLYQKARKALLINIPIGDGWEHPETHGNPAELHRSQWHADDFAQYPADAAMFTLPCGQYGVFWCPKDAPVEARITGLVAAANVRESRGENDAAMRLLRQAQALNPASEEVLTPLVDALITAGNVQEAIKCLQDGVNADPGAHSVRLLLARVLAATSRHAEAHQQLNALLKEPTVPEDIAEAAKKHIQDIRRRYA